MGGWRLCFELAGVLGIDPGPLTLRELVWMAEARTRHDWSQTSSLLALIANAHRDRKKAKPFKPSDFDPTTGRHRASDDGSKPVVGVEILKQVFLKGKQ